MSLRVAYVLKMFPRFSETFILHELLELKRRRIEVVIYSLKQPTVGPRHPSLTGLCASVTMLPERPIQWLTRGLGHALWLLVTRPRRMMPLLAYVATRRTHQAWKRLFQAAALVAAERRRPADRFHAHFASAPARVAMFAAALTGRPFSFTAHAKDIYQQGTDHELLRDKIHAAEFVVTVSDFNRAHLIALAGPEAAANVRRLYNGVDLAMFDAAAARPSPNGHGPIVLAVGRLVEKKGFDDLLRSWRIVQARVPTARLVIVGDGPDAGALHRLASALALDGAVEFRGAEHQDRVREWMRRATLFCLPCRVARDGNRDGLPTVLLEALASGVPCVTTCVTGIPEIVRDGLEGRVVPPADVDALAGALIDLLADADTRQAMRRAGRLRAEALFDLRRNVGRLAAWFEGRP